MGIPIKYWLHLSASIGKLKINITSIGTAEMGEMKF